MTLKSIFFLAGICCIIACNNPQNNRNDISDTPVAPQADSSALTMPTPHITDSGKRTMEGTSQDSIRSSANPLYKGDNTDTGLQRRR